MIDELYKKLFDAQLDKNWGKVAKIQLEINKAEKAESRGKAGEGSVESDLSDVRNHEGTV